MTSSPVLIGIAGISGSGKSTLADRLATVCNGVVLAVDRYYRDLSNVAANNRARYNFDHPSAIEVELLAGHLVGIAQGRSVQVPKYNFSNHTRGSECAPLHSSRIVFLEGLHAFYWPGIRRLLDFGIFVACDSTRALTRRVSRDVRVRSRTEQSIVEQWHTSVAPMASRYILPTQRYADVSVNGAHDFTKQLTTIVERVHESEKERVISVFTQHSSNQHVVTSDHGAL